MQVYKNARSKRNSNPYIEAFKNSAEKGYRFCDLVTSHTMRRTAITTMLSLGMTEFMVRKISGHSANSKEFFRYVALSQTYIDKETEALLNAYRKLNF
jgi:integrase